MGSVSLRPLPYRPILLVEPPAGRPCWLVIADTHLGLSAPERSGHGPPRASAPEMAEQVVQSAREFRSHRLVHLGDVKEPIVGTPPNLRAPIFEFFSTILREGISVDLVLGNHDVGLVRHLPREVRVHPAEGLSRYGVGMFHGHRWPGEHLRGARTLLAGHLHPGVRLAATGSGEGGKRPCWVRVRFPRQVRKNPARGSGGGYAAQELVVLPPFNPIAGTEALNRERPSRGRSFLYREFLCRGRRRAYLLDGTDLGDVLMTGPSPRPPAGGSARPGR